MALKIAMKTVAKRGCQNEIGEDLYTDQGNNRGRGYKTGIQNKTGLFYPDKKNEFFGVGVLHSPSRQRKYALGFEPIFCDAGERGVRNVRAGL